MMLAATDALTPYRCSWKPITAATLKPSCPGGPMTAFTTPFTISFSATGKAAIRERHIERFREPNCTANCSTAW